MEIPVTGRGSLTLPSPTLEVRRRQRNLMNVKVDALKCTGGSHESRGGWFLGARVKRWGLEPRGAGRKPPESLEAPQSQGGAVFIPCLPVQMLTSHTLSSVPT